MLLLFLWQLAIYLLLHWPPVNTRVSTAGAWSCAKYLWGRGREILQDNDVQMCVVRYLVLQGRKTCI